jgi:hypothetical protein
VLTLPEVVWAIVDAAGAAGAWRPLLGLLASAVPALVAFLALPDSIVRLWITGGILALGIVGGLVWEWRAGDRAER